MTTFIPPQNRAAWQALHALSEQPLPHLRDLLAGTEPRADWQATGAGLTLDYSRQRLTAPVLQQLFALANESGVMAQAHALFRGEPINRSENRAVLHVALRGSQQANPPWGPAVSQAVANELQRFCGFAERCRAGGWQGFGGEAITDVVNLGIGGSDLGPRMATEALAYSGADAGQGAPVRVHYVSNVDAWSLHTSLARLQAGRTGFVVQSKTFTTQETLTLLASAKTWLLDAGCPPERLAQQLAAVTARPALAGDLGFLPEQTFLFWDWVGGRYSLWSAIGLPVAMAIGAPAFTELLRGAHDMDQHFMSAPPAHNLPLLMALLGIWNRNFLGAPTHHIAPYAACLGRFVPFIQQMDMESNGKRSHIDGSAAHIATGPVVWGGLGIDGQHAYFQLIHQGQHLVSTDFIGARRSSSALPGAAEHQRVVLLNLQAQAQALARGRSVADTAALLQASGTPPEQVQALAEQRSYPGNRPSNIVWLDTVTPHSLGALIALYEHKLFCQAAIWGINAYDQWGVELGKTLAKAMEASHV